MSFGIKIIVAGISIPRTNLQASGEVLGIGNKGKLPWRLKGDMEYFKQKTVNTLNPNKQNAVIMGRKTWESIPNSFKPLQHRLNIVISSQPSWLETLKGTGAIGTSSFEEAVNICRQRQQNANNLTNELEQEKEKEKEKEKEIESIFVIGGSAVYDAAIKSGLCESIYLTKVYSAKEIICDTYFPDHSNQLFQEDPAQTSRIMEEDDLKYQFCVLVNTSIV